MLKLLLIKNKVAGFIKIYISICYISNIGHFLVVSIFLEKFICYSTPVFDSVNPCFHLDVDMTSSQYLDLFTYFYNEYFRVLHIWQLKVTIDAWLCIYQMKL